MRTIVPDEVAQHVQRQILGNENILMLARLIEDQEGILTMKYAHIWYGLFKLIYDLQK